MISLPLLRTDGPPAEPHDGLPPVPLPHGDPKPADGARAVAWASLAVLLGYPDEAVTDRLPFLDEVLEDAAPALPEAVRTPLHRLLVHLRTATGLRSQQDYVRTFDTRRRSCLYLTYYLHGDTRRRGAALWRVKAALAACGYEPAGGELPDHLPALCELAAVGDESVAVRLLEEHRRGLMLLQESLATLGSPYAWGVDAVLALLPEPDAATAAALERAARALAAEGPPTEAVGLASWTAPFARSTGERR